MMNFLGNLGIMIDVILAVIFYSCGCIFANLGVQDLYSLYKDKRLTFDFGTLFISLIIVVCFPGALWGIVLILKEKNEIPNNVLDIVGEADKLYRCGKIKESWQLYYNAAKKQSYKAAKMYTLLTCYMIEEKNSFIRANEGIKLIDEAEGLLNKSTSKENTKETNDLLTQENGLYALKIYLMLLVAIEKDNKKEFKKIIELYNKCQQPTNRTTYSYMTALENLNQQDQAYDQAFKMIDNLDGTLEQWMLKDVCLTLSEMHFKGIKVVPNYEKSYAYLKAAYKGEANNQVLKYYESGKAKTDFIKLHRR